MMMRKLVPMAALAVVALLMAAPVQADSIGPTCGTCQGSIYTLTNLGTVGPAGTTDIQLTINTSGYTGGGTFIDAAGIKVLSSMSGTTLISAPGGVSNWNLILGSLNASGCQTNSGQPFACADDLVSGTGGHAAVGGTLIWVFRVPSTGPFLDPSSIKARYVDNNGNKVGDLVSENITLQTPVPEPGTLALFGTGLIGVATVIRRRLGR